MLFEDVTLVWKGEDYIIPANQVMRLIAKIEDIITLGRLSAGDPPFGKVSQAFGVALRHSGANVTDEEVYAALFDSEGVSVIAAVELLLMMMMPPEAMRKAEAAQEKKNKARSE
jgi:hypothetical protein|tara:strand:- start:956 stop:1297 length:342 start_codon:yes stop_codon:yes gene_type:complete